MKAKPTHALTRANGNTRSIRREADEKTGKRKIPGNPDSADQPLPVKLNQRECG
jgi:hypothetical protein